MIGRRSLLSLFIASPIASVAKDIDVPPPYSEPYNSVGMDTSPLADAYRKARNIAERRQNSRGRPIRHMPPHIAEKRSWSSAFKAHVCEQEDKLFYDHWNWEHRDETIMRAALKSVGIKI